MGSLKNLWAEFVGHAHAESVRFVLPITVYSRTSPLVLRLGDGSCQPSYPTKKPVWDFVAQS